MPVRHYTPTDFDRIPESLSKQLPLPLPLSTEFEAFIAGFKAAATNPSPQAINRALRHWFEAHREE